VFNESQARIKSMALVHEKLYQTVDLAQVDFADYVHSLVSMLVASNNMKASEVAVDVRAQSLKLDIERAIPAGLILNELVSNSFKHAFPLGRAGRLEVTLATRAETLVMLAVRDDGVGPPETFDPTSSPTLGLRLVHILSGQLGATLSFHHDKGFACELTFDRLGDSSRIRERETQEAPTAQQREKE
jgi:two-component sensor histidine kinase